MDKETQERWDAIYDILRFARPYGLEVECLDHFIQEVSSPHFKGDYKQAASDVLYEWDI